MTRKLRQMMASYLLNVTKYLVILTLWSGGSFASAMLFGRPPIFCEQALGGRGAVQVRPPVSPERPTYLLLPGLNRSLLLEEAAVQALVANGSGAITFNFSVQAFAVHQAGGVFGATPPTLKTLALEVQEIAEYARGVLGLTNIIPVSLSYSGAVSAGLTGFDTLIDVAPLTSDEAHDAQFSAYLKSLRSMEGYYPFGAGELITRQLIDAAYRSHWTMAIEKLVWRYALWPHRRVEMIEGHTRLSRAIEGFKWRQGLGGAGFRVFVLAQDESASLLRDQLRTIHSLSERAEGVAVVIVRESGHIVPVDQPQVFARVLHMVGAGEIRPGSVTVLSPQAGDGGAPIVSAAGDLGEFFSSIRDMSF